MYLSPHFDSTEFTCKCGCGQTEIRSTLLNRLEQLHDAMDARAINISSGYRCPTHSVNVGGSGKDAHTKGFAADICVKKQDGTYFSSLTIAEQAEKLGFGGIGLINDTYCHVDTRDVEFYNGNTHWWADERNSQKYDTFAGLGEKVTPRTSTSSTSTEVKEIIKEVKVEPETVDIKVSLGGETIYEGKVVKE